MGTRLAEVVASYKSALQDLTFNSKPLINVLTMLAEENTDNGLSIVQVICDRIKEVGIDKKLPSLYLLDSILKNVGGNYVNIISICIVEIFCHVFENAKDERNRMSLFKLRKTWTQYIPAKTLHELDVRSNKADPNWPMMSPVENNQVNPIQQNKIHVNPKFLQKSDLHEKENSKDHVIEEEKRIQNEKIKKEREAHEMMLKKKQVERERVLADQKRQLDLLRKQQQTMTQSPLQINTNQPMKKEAMKDPRLKTTSPHEERSAGKWGEKVGQQPSHNIPKVSPKATKNKNPISVVNKIMKNFSGKKPAKLVKKTSPTQIIPKPEKIKKPLRNWDGTYAEENLPKEPSSKELPVPPKVEQQVSTTATFENTTAPTLDTIASSAPSLPFSAAFSGLSSRDMQIAAQAAAIATAMHQMQSSGNGPMAPVQSADFAAQFIKMMQGTSQQLSMPTTTVTVTESCSSSSATTNQTSTSTTATVLNDHSAVSAKEISKPTINTDKKLKNHKEKQNKIVSSNNNKLKEESKEKTKNNVESKIDTDRKKKVNDSNQRKDHAKLEPPIKKIKDKPVERPHKPPPQSKPSDTKEKVGEKSKDRKEAHSDKLEPPVKKSKGSGNEPAERPRKARARSPSRYYCQIEQKTDSEKRVEKREKELNLQRIRKSSEGDSTEVDGKSKEHHKIYKQFIAHIEALEKRYKAPKSTINKSTLESVFKQIDSKFKRKMISFEQYNELIDKLDAFASRIAGKASKVGVRSQPENVFSPNKPHDRFAPRIPHNEISRVKHPPVPDNTVPFHPRDGMPPFMRGPRPQFRDGPPPPHRRGPMHVADGPPPPHMRDMPPQHFREGPPQHFIDRPMPIHEGPLPHHLHQGPEGPLPPQHLQGPMHLHEGQLPPPHLREGPMPMRDGQLPPPHLREGPMNLHEVSRPPHDGAPRIWDGRGDHQQWRDSPPPHMMEGGPPIHMMEGGPPPHMMEGGPPPHMMEGGPSMEFRPRDGPPEYYHGAPQFMERPPHHLPRMMDGPPRDSPNMMERVPFGPGPFPEPPMNHQGMAPPGTGAPLNVNNILGQLMAFGVIKPEEQEIDEPVPEMPWKIEDLKRRHRSIVKQLFLGLQCSSCGERFPESHKQQYSDHLDWHFQENKKEKEGVRKVSSRSWYYDLAGWIEFSDDRLGEDGKVKSAFFELAKSEYGRIDGGNILPKQQSPSIQSVPVGGDENSRFCGVCMDPLEEYWDEDLEEWRYKNAVTEDNKNFHVGCFKDYVPYELDESVTPATTPSAEKASPFDLPDHEFDMDNEEVLKEEDSTADDATEDSSHATKEIAESIKTEPVETMETESNVVLETNVQQAEIVMSEVQVKLEESDVISDTVECRVDEKMTSSTDKNDDDGTMAVDSVELDNGDKTNKEVSDTVECLDDEKASSTANGEETKLGDNGDDIQRTDDIKIEANEDFYMENTADSPEFPVIVSSNVETLMSNDIAKSEEPR